MAKKMITTKLAGLIKRWRQHINPSPPSDVPAGHVAILVGPERMRCIVHVTHLNHPAFRKILDEAEEEYGFNYSEGPISVPCDVSAFFEALRLSAAPSGYRVIVCPTRFNRLR